MICTKIDVLKLINIESDRFSLFLTSTYLLPLVNLHSLLTCFQLSSEWLNSEWLNQSTMSGFHFESVGHKHN